MAPESAKVSPLGILGGTFDPIHIAHLRLAQEALEVGGLGAVRFIPAGRPSHRGQPAASAADRLAMAELALEDWPQFELDAAEALSGAPSYTVPTLERLRGELGEQRPLVLLLGADAFLGLPSWHRWRELFTLAHILVATRPGHVMDFTSEGTKTELADELRSALHGRFVPQPPLFAASPCGLVSHFAMTALDVSATAIRQGVAAGNSACFLVPDGVLNYIQTHKLYTSGAAVAPSTPGKSLPHGHS